MRFRIINLSLCLLFSLILVGILYAVSDKLNHRPNGFIRLIPSHAVNVQNDFSFNGSNLYIAGATSNHIYLGNYHEPNKLMIVGKSLADTQSIDIAPKNIRLVWWSVRVEIDSPNVYLWDGITKVILHFRLTETTTPEYIPVSVNFDEGMMISPGSFVLRTYKKNINGNVLSKGKVNAGYMDDKYSILEQQIDGVFSTDGIISFSNPTRTLVYTYFYRNQFICLDSNLKILYRGRTIDTNSVAKLQIKSYESGKSRTLAAPPLQVNLRCAVDEGRIFIHSALLSNNEDKKLFDRASVIDMYSLADGKYLKSFYLPMHNGNRMSDFVVTNRNIVTLYSDGLIWSSLNF